MANDRDSKLPADDLDLPVFGRKASPLLSAEQRQISDNAVAYAETSRSVAGYEAPFPDDSYKAGARVFPSLIPTTPDNAASDANRAAWAELARFDRPFLCCFSDSDPITAGADAKLLDVVPGTAGQPHTTIAGAGHFLQEDRGEELAGVLVDWLAEG